MGFPRQEYWSGLTFPSPGDLPDPGIKPLSSAASPAFQAGSLPGKLASTDNMAYKSRDYQPLLAPQNLPSHLTPGIPRRTRKIFVCHRMPLLLLLSRFSHVRLCAIP